MDTSLGMANGTTLPQVGLGTVKLTREALETALDTGYKLLDTARLYGSEPLIGQVLKERFSEGRLKREDIFITSKIPMTYMGSRELVRRCVDLSLRDLQLDYIDLYLIHYPLGFQFKDDETFFPYDDEGNIILDMNSDFIQVWQTLEKYVDDGRIKALGVSHFTISQMKKIQAIARHPLCNNQIELSVYLQQRPFVEYCKKNHITVTAFGTIGSPGSDHVRGKNYPSILEDETLLTIAADKGKSAAQVAMRFLLQEGVAIISNGGTPNRIVENSQLFDFNLTDDEMGILRKKDQHMRRFFLPKTKAHPEYPYEKD